MTSLLGHKPNGTWASMENSLGIDTKDQLVQHVLGMRSHDNQLRVNTPSIRNDLVNNGSNPYFELHVAQISRRNERLQTIQRSSGSVAPFLLEME